MRRRQEPYGPQHHEQLIVRIAESVWLDAHTSLYLALDFRVRQTERGENLDADLVERAKAIVDRYDRAMMKGHEAPGVIPFRRD